MLGSILNITGKEHIFGPFSKEKVTPKSLGNTLGDIFTNTSGHPA
jgi:hypothetical protein